MRLFFIEFTVVSLLEITEMFVAVKRIEVNKCVFCKKKKIIFVETAAYA